MEKKKVLFVATVVKTHLMQFHIPYLKMFQDMGWETSVAARNDYENPADCVIPYCDHYYDVPFARLPWKGENRKALGMLKDILRREHFEIIHCHTPVGAMLARLAAGRARREGTRVIYTAHGFHFFRGAPLINWLAYYPVEWLLSFSTDVLITINREDYALAKRRMHAREIRYVPGVGIDTARFSQIEADPAAKRRELGLRESDFVLLTVAEMTRNKNHTTVLDALALLRQEPEFAHMHYLICGRGEMWEALEQQAKELGLEDRVHFLGYRGDVPELYRASDLFVFMSHREGLPVALMEAMASGLPALCSRVRGNTELIEDGVTGAFADNTPQAVAAGILSLCRSPERREALGQAAARKAAEYDSREVHRQMREIYFGD